jgi:hypothetical protein
MPATAPVFGANIGVAISKGAAWLIVTAELADCAAHQPTIAGTSSSASVSTGTNRLFDRALASIGGEPEATSLITAPKQIEVTHQDLGSLVSYHCGKGCYGLLGSDRSSGR